MQVKMQKSYFDLSFFFSIERKKKKEEKSGKLKFINCKYLEIRVMLSLNRFEFHGDLS